MRSDPDPQWLLWSAVSVRHSCLKMAGTADIKAGHDYRCVLRETQLSVESLWLKKYKPTVISVSLQGPVARRRWRIAGGLLGQPQQYPAGGSGSPAHSVGSRQPSKAWQKLTPFHAATLRRKTRWGKVQLLIFLSCRKTTQSSLYQKYSAVFLRPHTLI